MRALKQKLIIVCTMLCLGLFSSCIDLIGDDDPCTACNDAVRHYEAAANRYGCDRAEIFKNAYHKMYAACGRKALDYQWMICSGESPLVCE